MRERSRTARLLRLRRLATHDRRWGVALLLVAVVAFLAIMAVLAYREPSEPEPATAKAHPMSWRP